MKHQNEQARGQWMKIFTLLLVLFSLARPERVSSQELPALIGPRLDQICNDALADWKIPGMAICIVQGNKVVYMKAYGVRKLGEEAPVNTNTLFMIASNTKPFTATALCMLAEQGLCKLNDPVEKYLPAFRMNADYSSSVTLRDLLTHKLGLRTFEGDFMYFYSKLKPSEVYGRFSLLKPTQVFRQDYGYCNAAYFLAGEVVGKASGGSWDSCVRKLLLEPLGMNRTLTSSAKIGQYNNLAWGHTFEDGIMTAFPHANIDVIAPAAAMSTSAEDISHWMIAQLNEGRYNGLQVIPRKVIQATRQPQTIIGRNSHLYYRTHYSLYGLGWSLEDYEGVEVISHGGGIRGFYSDVALVPELQLGVAVFTNNDENWFYEGVRWMIIDAFLGLPWKDYSSDYLSIYTERQQKQEQMIGRWKDTVAMKLPWGLDTLAYCGQYISHVYGSADIVRRGDELEISFSLHPDLKGRLQSMGGNRFLCTYHPTRFGTRVIEFTTREQRVVKVEIGVAERLEKTVYEFFRQP